jgi:hypothetical protein
VNRTDLTNARRTAAEFLRETTGSDRPQWRATFIGESFLGDSAEGPNAIGPVCTDPGHVESEDPSAFDCCPEPIIEIDPPLVEYFLALLNADREAGEQQ